MRILFILDPLDSIKTYKDTSYAMMQEAVARGHRLAAMRQEDLIWQSGQVICYAQDLELTGNDKDWYRVSGRRAMSPRDFDCIIMRKDPPFDMEYVYTTYILDRAKADGVLIVNDPQALRDMNEKAYTAWFPECTPLTLITRSMDDMKGFLADHGRVVVKPLDGMGGRSIFVVISGDNNANVIFETLTDHGQRFAMAQVYIPEISLGDKRILLIDGEPIPHALARIPSGDDNRGNIVAGALAKGQDLSDSDCRICDQVGPVLRDAGVLFAGIDVIGDYLTEVNVTSPTGIRELDRQFELNIAGNLFDAIEDKLA